ncbi:MAG TPA: DegQ family serine endoprotease [Stellaceae bacterium]|nr:DegQ family serine endoprotease [Stellaceae bacterium]
MSSSNLKEISWHRARFAALAAGVSLCFIGAPMALAENASPPLNRNAAAASAITPLPSFGPLVKKVMPAVVNIRVTERSPQVAEEMQGNGENDQSGPGNGPNFPPSPFGQFLHRFFGQQGPGFGGPMPQQHIEMALGSGFIIDPSGYIVTNNHVVKNGKKITVVFQDGSRHPAKLIGTDPKTDLALLKITADHPLPYVSWGNSNAAQVGDWVVAVGNPFGLGGTVSSGIISARGRDIHAGPYDDFLQLDASINRGNSGGPTFNLEGQVIGINTAIYSPNGGSVGIGFAIPSSLAQPVIAQLREHGKVERGWLGVQIQTVTPDLAKGLGLAKPEGALVADVTAGGPAAKVGIKQGDVILTYEGHDLAKMRDLPLEVADTPIGHKVPLKVWRDGHDVTLEPTIAEMPAHPQRVAENGNGGAASAMGLKLAPLTANLRHELHVEKDVKGVVVMQVAPNSPLASLGVERGDVVEAINRHPVGTPEQAAHQLDQVAHEKGNNRSVLLLLNRHGVNQYVAMTVQAGNG